VLYVSHQPTGAVLNDETIATEIVRTLIGSLGIIAAIPITTFIAGLLAEGRDGDAEGWETFRSRSLSRLLVTIAGIITLLVATTVISLGGPPRTALTTTALVPSPSAGQSGPVDGATTPPDQSPGASSASNSTPELFNAGQTIPITVDGSSAGTVAVVPTRTKASGQASGSHVSVTVHYVATGTFPMAAGQWDVLLEDGSLVPLVAADPNAMGRTLNAGERFDLKASADISATPKNLFVVYVDTKTSEMILAVPIS
jgi:hypothetical protein